MHVYIYIYIYIKTVPHPPYSPDLAPCDFWLYMCMSIHIFICICIYKLKNSHPDQLYH